MVTMQSSVAGYILVSLACIQGGAWGLQWQSSSALPDNFTVPTCIGQDVTLAWDYATESGEQVVNVEWRFRPAHGTTEEVLATGVNGHFFADPSVHQKIEFIPGAGIRLFNATEGYNGTYLVRVNLNVNGSIQTRTQSVNVIVTNESIASMDRIQAQQLGARFMAVDQQQHIVLTCGHFSSLWMPSLEVVWTTPQNETLASTFHENGQFGLAIPNPFHAGQYTCHIADNSPATVCIASDSPLREVATVELDATQARIALLASELQHMQQQVLGMGGQLQDLTANNSVLTMQFLALQAQRANLSTWLHALNLQKENLTNILSNVTHGQLLVSPSGDVRLVGGHLLNEGRVEVRINGVWGTVCDNGFVINAAAVLCRELGLPERLARAMTGAYFGQGAGPVHLQSVGCFGTESSILRCQATSPSSCPHSRDVGVVCQA